MGEISQEVVDELDRAVTELERLAASH